MALSQTDLDAAVAAWATGALRVDYASGGGVTYRSRADLEAAIGKMAAALGLANPISASSIAAPSVSLATHSKC